MPLKLTITSYQRLSPGQESTKVLDRGSTSIGRAAQNDWILQDPERILSGVHCTVHYQNGDYYLTDKSTNGVYLNDSEQRIGRGQMVKLKDGDHFILGEYEIAVNVISAAAESDELEPEGPLTAIIAASDSQAAAIAPAVPLVPGERRPSPPALASTSKPSFAEILAEDQSSGSGWRQPVRRPSAERAVTEPPPDSGAPEGGLIEIPEMVPETPPPLPPIAEQQPPAAAESPTATAANLPPVAPVESTSEPTIPEDWWMTPIAPVSPQPLAEAPRQPSVPTPFAEPGPFAPPPVVEEPVKPVLSALEPPPPVPPARPTLPTPPPTPGVAVEIAGPSARALLRTFLDSAGLPHTALTEDQLPEVMAHLGAILRETVQGLMDILLARSDIKGEFRLDRTTIGPVENNPLKTPPGQTPLSSEEVMTLLLIRQKDAYMSPVQAVREGFNDIKAHQLAVMAGIQAALTRLLGRFDPHSLETRLQQTVLDSFLPVNRKAKYWDLFTAEYQSIASEAEDDFNELFGKEFARAYEERLRTH